ncbi:hypothetical protein ACQKTA_09020 [Enterococcus sp. 22-H-5-01]|uniref:hypothetical protein n=1 Tax=Enterococcus sp. 22-H-5-01 TaxID=3418555 RepID=UPI003CFCEC45
MSKDELIMEANYLNSSLMGLDSYIYDRFSGVNSITVDDISGLSGLIAAIKALSEKHVEHSIHRLEGSE